MPIDRLIKTTTRDNLWIYILTLLKRKPMYAYEIGREIKENFDFQIGNVTAYLILYSLERKKLVSSKWSMHKRRQRKYYTITDNGGEVLDEGVKYLRELARKLG